MATKKHVTEQLAALVAALCGSDCSAELRQAITDGATFELTTTAGLLRGAVIPPMRQGNRWCEGWLHLRFEDVARAREALPMDPRLNVHSGKWNWMHSNLAEPWWLRHDLADLQASGLTLCPEVP